MVRFFNDIRVRFVVFMYNGKFVPKGGFCVNDIGVGMAFKWAKMQPHPFDNGRTLYDYVCNFGSEPHLMFRVINDIAMNYSQVRAK